MGVLANHLHKMYKHYGKWARRQGITCFRLYNHDIPEYPLIVDYYEGYVAIWASKRTRDVTSEERENFLRESLSEIVAGLEIGLEKIFLKDRHPGGQYRRQADKREGRFFVQEGGLKFKVDLGSYHDTGLFLDHRQTRALVAQEAPGKSFLNLFCYTGSFTVYASQAGARNTVSVDLSKRYLDWAEENLLLNNLGDKDNTLIEDDVMLWLKDTISAGEKFDLIVCDPPTFSNSKSTASILDIQRDHKFLIESCLQLLPPGGSLYFSTNKRNFTLAEIDSVNFTSKEITSQTVPNDFRDSSPHRVWRFTTMYSD
ncbi:class I SAM-dependent methyltransferase [bacterium]|nr:class I SAM-dependent methyltransferase [bacterium]